MNHWKKYFSVLIVAVAVAGATATTAENDHWKVSKTSGEVWLGANGAQQVSLRGSAEIKAGDTIRTGGNGRVLLTRGSESILVAPNSVIALPESKKDSQRTTILQRAGTIVLEVEKRDRQHFEVETPYLVAVVKGTQFKVSVGGGDTKVDVSRGQVEVADMKTGKFALVLPGQAARVSGNGLALSGAGKLNSIQQGNPRTPSPMPALNNSMRTADLGAKNSHTRITTPLGEVKMNVHQATKGLARSAHESNGKGSKSSSGSGSDTVWATRELSPNNGAAKGSAASASLASNGGGSSASAAASGNNGAGNAGGNGNGNAYAKGACNGNGKGKGNSC